MKIILLGYMGSGKSTIGSKLAEITSSNHIDLDNYISEKENDTINNIFKNKGEIYFRKKESEYLRFLLESDKNFILSLGGGTPCYANNMDLINKKSTSIYLKASIDELFNRLKKGKSKRPLIKNIENKDLKEFIAKHLFDRRPFYEKAIHTVVVDGKSIKKIVKEIKTNML